MADNWDAFDLNLCTSDYFETLRGLAAYHEDMPEEDHLRISRVLMLAGQKIVSSTKSKWNPPTWYPFPAPSPNVAFGLSDGRGSLSLSIWNFEIHLQFVLGNLRELPSMDNHFWAEFAQWIDDHSLKYEKGCSVISKESNPNLERLSRFRKAATFTFLFDLFANAKNSEPGYDYPHADFTLSFPNDLAWDAIVERSTAASHAFCRLAQSLHRSAYIKSQNHLRRHRRIAETTKIWRFARLKRWTHKDSPNWPFFDHEFLDLPEQECRGLLESAQLTIFDFDGDQAVNSYEEMATIHRLNGFDQWFLEAVRRPERTNPPPWFAPHDKF